MKKQTVKKTDNELVTKKEFNEGLGRVDERFEQIDVRFEQIDVRFEQIDVRFEQIDKRFEQIDERFEKVDIKFEKVDKRFDKVELALQNQAETLIAHSKKFDDIEQKMATKADNERIINLLDIVVKKIEDNGNKAIVNNPPYQRN